MTNKIFKLYQIQIKDNNDSVGNSDNELDNVANIGMRRSRLTQYMTPTFYPASNRVRLRPGGLVPLWFYLTLCVIGLVVWILVQILR